MRVMRHEQTSLRFHNIVHALEPNIQVLIAPIATQMVHEGLALTQTSTDLLAPPQLARETLVALLIGKSVRTHVALLGMLRNKTIQLSRGNQHLCPSVRCLLINVAITSILDLASRNVALLILTEPHGSNHLQRMVVFLAVLASQRPRAVSALAGVCVTNCRHLVTSLFAVTLSKIRTTKSILNSSGKDKPKNGFIWVKKEVV